MTIAEIQELLNQIKSNPREGSDLEYDFFVTFIEYVASDESLGDRQLQEKAKLVLTSLDIEKKHYA
jgi:hypothetical protein